MHTLADIIAPPTIDKKTFVREIVITMATYNIGAVAERSYTNGVFAFAGKAYMLADGFQKGTRLQGSKNAGLKKEGPRKLATTKE